MLLYFSGGKASLRKKWKTTGYSWDPSSSPISRSKIPVGVHRRRSTPLPYTSARRGSYFSFPQQSLWKRKRQSTGSFPRWTGRW